MPASVLSGTKRSNILKLLPDGNYYSPQMPRQIFVSKSAFTILLIAWQNCWGFFLRARGGGELLTVLSCFLPMSSPFLIYSISFPAPLLPCLWLFLTTCSISLSLLPNASLCLCSYLLHLRLSVKCTGFAETTEVGPRHGALCHHDSLPEGGAAGMPSVAIMANDQKMSSSSSAAVRLDKGLVRFRRIFYSYWLGS